MKLRALALGVTLLFCTSAHANSLRCKHRVIKAGMTALELRAYCGDPDDRRVRPVLRAVTALDVRGLEVTRYVEEAIETWMYATKAERSGELIREVQIERGKITRIQTLSRAQTAKSRDCGRATFPNQTRISEILYACGEPFDRSNWTEERLVRQRRRGRQLEVRNLVSFERWVYDPGPGRLLRIFEFENDRLVKISTGGRSPSGSR